jgi:hypothetical protein
MDTLATTECSSDLVINHDCVVTVDNSKASFPKTRGPGYSPTEDVVICQAWIAASENPLVGCSQKLSTFVSVMHEAYLTFIVAAERQKGTQPRRSPTAIHTRFKEIMRMCTKLHGVIKTTTIQSGMTDEDHFRFCLDLYKDRFNESVYDMQEPYKYLASKAKLNSSAVANGEVPPLPRPFGKKKAARICKKEKQVTQVLLNNGFQVPPIVVEGSDDQTNVSPLSEIKTINLADVENLMAAFTAIADAFKFYAHSQSDYMKWKMEGGSHRKKRSKSPSSPSSPSDSSDADGNNLLSPLPNN